MTWNSEFVPFCSINCKPAALMSFNNRSKAPTAPADRCYHFTQQCLQVTTGDCPTVARGYSCSETINLSSHSPGATPWSNWYHRRTVGVYLQPWKRTHAGVFSHGIQTQWNRIPGLLLTSPVNFQSSVIFKGFWSQKEKRMKVTKIVKINLLPLLSPHAVVLLRTHAFYVVCSKSFFIRHNYLSSRLISSAYAHLGE